MLIKTVYSVQSFHLCRQKFKSLSSILKFLGVCDSFSQTGSIYLLALVLTWRTPSPPGRSRTRCCRWSGSKSALRSPSAAGRRSPRPPTHRTARTGSGRSRRRTLAFLYPTPGPSSLESPGKKQKETKFRFCFKI